MVDISFLRAHPKEVEDSLKNRGMKDQIPDIKKIIKLDAGWRKHKQKTDSLRQQRNKITQKIKEAKEKGKTVKSLLAKAKKIPKSIHSQETKTLKIKEKINTLLLTLPNTLHPSVPKGSSETDNQVLKIPIKPPKLSFHPKSHVDLLQSLNGADLARAAKTSGARFYFLTNDLVRLDFALMNFALDHLQKKNFSLMEPPLMIRRNPYEGVTDLGDFEEVIYKIEAEDLYLIATSEHAIAAFHMDEILDAKQLPLRYAGISPCLRKEAGAHGKDTRGIFRVHQFNKVEQFIFSKPEDSWRLHEELRENTEELYRQLHLPYRVVNLCSGDIGKGSAKTYDLEAWFPAQQRYGEVASCSNVTDYQSGRLKIRYRDPHTKETKLVHTLNSTAIATSRTIVAILENYQQKDGSVKIPKALYPYSFGLKEIRPPSPK